MRKVQAMIPKTKGRVAWESPANIALVKYWGKQPVQIPMNPSLSFVLKKSVVEINMDYVIDPDNDFKIKKFTLNGKSSEPFSEKTEQYLVRLNNFFPFLKHTQLVIDSRSTFPHSAGIASSAAAFSALALCICTIDARINEKKGDGDEFMKKASHMARLGSGSACRSLYEGMVLWGETPLVSRSSGDHAIRLSDDLVNNAFMRLNDAILITDSSTKRVSSTHGHALMDHHPYREQRKIQSGINLEKMLAALAEGDFTAFGEVVESEALGLHGLMMLSTPPYLLMHPNTIRILEKVRMFREETAIPAYATLDAGPNIHLIYPETVKSNVLPFIEQELTPYCEGKRWIDDRMGDGPNRL